MQKRIIGLTGGIATGKSTVSSYLFQTHQLPILDADSYAREAVKPDSVILDNIVKRYGNRVQRSDRHLNRKALGEIIFNNLQEKEWLESQIHPYVRDRIQSTLSHLSNPIIILDIPLLFEAKMTDLATEIWVVFCSEEQQIQRLRSRNSLTLEEAKSRINSQIPLPKKIAAADVVLDNSSTLEALFNQVDAAIINS